MRRLIKDKAIRKNTEKMLLNLDLSEKYRFQLPISTRKNDALLMLYPTETLDLLPPDAQIDAHLKHQMGISRPRAVAKTQKESPRNGLFKPFLGLFVWQGQKDLNPRHAVLEAMEKAQKRDK